MNDYVKDRILAEARYILSTGCGLKEVAEHFMISKSTAHKDLHYKLKNIVPIDIYASVQNVLDYNKSKTSRKDYDII